MKKDILMPKVSDVYVAIVKDIDGGGSSCWNAYLINNKNEPIVNAFVSSKGYLTDVEGNESKSSILRHYYKEVPAKSAQKIEIVVQEVLKLNNEYFVSFYFQGNLLDKRFVFLSETIHEKNASNVPVIQKKGVWIK